MPTRKSVPASSRNAAKIISVNSVNVLEPASPTGTAIPPQRPHVSSYHWPLLLNDDSSCNSLLSWFTDIEEARDMPWRKPFIHPMEFKGSEEELGRVLAKRAYEVWVSEIMLQQTRVATVIPYFKNWIEKWPTVQDLADAKHDDVLAAWKGLGYYSRATRLHQGAQDMVSQYQRISCPIPKGAEELQQFSGIGKYTAGAISSIAFGEPEPVLDGNVIRVLSRQLGLYTDAKDKKTSDLLWKVADRLVKHVANHEKVGNSEIPGRWNQALMELGSTVCTPRPKCDSCPIQTTCRVYAEGEILSKGKKIPVDTLDIEDACSYCEQLDMAELLAVSREEENQGDEFTLRPTKKIRQVKKANNTISRYFGVVQSIKETTVLDEQTDDSESSQSNRINKRKAVDTGSSSKNTINYCSLFPKKVAKKKVPEEACVVCLLELKRNGESRWLIEQRPPKGLLASLWQFPQSTLSEPGTSASVRKSAARKFISDLDLGLIVSGETKHMAEVATHLHVFTHLKLTMHIHHFVIDGNGGAESPIYASTLPKRKWVGTDEMDNETLSTGMRKCWDLVQKEIST